MSHTQGIWTAKLEQFDFTNGGERMVVYGDPDTDTYGTVALVRPRLERKERGKHKTPYNAPDAERDANALLIAAAPELLAALQYIARGYSGEVGVNSEGHSGTHCADIASAAIAKALGK